VRSLLRALGFALPYKGFLVALALASAAYASTNALFVLLTRDAFEAALLTKDQTGLWTIVILFAVVVVARGYFAYAQAYLSGYLANRVAREAQNHVMGKLVSLPLSYFHGQRTGELISRMTSDAGSLSRSVNLATELVKEPITLIAVAAMILNLKWQLALLGFVGFPLAVWPMVVLSRKIHRASQKTREKTADISSLMVQIFGGMRLVRAYGQERTEHGRFVDTNEAIFKQQMRSTRAQALGRPLVEILSSIGVAAVVLVGGGLVFSGAILAQDVVAFLVALGLMYGPAKALTRANEEIQASIPGANRLFELADARNDMPEAPDAVEIQGLREGLEFRNVTFSYVPGTPVLRAISLRIPAGRTVALVGPTGAGKSTLADLACRFYDPQEGAVTIDGLDLRRVRLRSLLDQIAIVPQEPFLFNDTIRANILYGRLGAGREEVEAAARAAAIHDEIAAMPEGYDTRVGERGTRLSGGQRQRVSIARALLRNAPILILDEATSSLDSQSEHLVQQAVDRLLAGRTTLVIAHRLSTIRNADSIAVLVDGRIEDSGTHDELLARSGTYRRLWEMQQAAPAPT
jgi:subfamily B ATP-binding cassette protein MsbA